MPRGEAYTLNTLELPTSPSHKLNWVRVSIIVGVAKIFAASHGLSLRTVEPDPPPEAAPATSESKRRRAGTLGSRAYNIHNEV